MLPDCCMCFSLSEKSRLWRYNSDRTKIMVIDSLTRPLHLPVKILREDCFSNFSVEEDNDYPRPRTRWNRRSELWLYLKGQWEHCSEQPSTCYLAYRWAHFAVLLVCLVLSLVTCPVDYALKCYIYMTTWAQCFHLYQAAIGAAIVTMGYRSNEPHRTISPQLVSLYGAHHATSVSLALAVSFVYWIFIYDRGADKLTLAKITSHGINSVVMLLDLLLVAHPVYLLDIAFPLCFGSVYTMFTVAYHYGGGTNAKGDAYVYKILDWSQPMDAMSFAVIGMCILIFMFLLVWFVANLRSSVAARLKPTYIIVHI
nr:protein rolling stone-like [Halyomorpha halys]